MRCPPARCTSARRLRLTTECRHVALRAASRPVAAPLIGRARRQLAADWLHGPSVRERGGARRGGEASGKAARGRRRLMAVSCPTVCRSARTQSQPEPEPELGLSPNPAGRATALHRLAMGRRMTVWGAAGGAGCACGGGPRQRRCWRPALWMDVPAGEGVEGDGGALRCGWCHCGWCCPAVWMVVAWLEGERCVVRPCRERGSGEGDVSCN